MEYSRRQMLGAGAAASFLATAAKGETLAEIVAGLKDKEPRSASVKRATAPARPRILVDPVIDARLLARARAAFDANRKRIRHTSLVGITDFGKASREPRFFILNTDSGQVTTHYVAHGRGSDPGHSGYLERFSNAYGSNATSAGAYVTGDFYYGKYGRSMKLKGLERRNDNAEGRAIVVHSAWYAEPEVIREHGKLGRSEGCFAFSYASLQDVLHRLGPGHLIYADKVA